jgi:tetratricopeptide (TPR) repeat protein
MIGRLTRSLALAAAALLTALPGRVQAQENSRYRVLVPDFFALEGADRGFGEDVAEEVRKLLEDLPTHQPIEKKEINDQLRQFKMKMEELDCLKTRQLATQINANLALCGSFKASGQNAYELSSIEFWDMGTGEPLKVENVAATGKDAKVQAAQHIFSAFDRMVQLARAQQFCADYANSQQWDNAMRNCDQALELNPNAVGTRMRKAQILYELAKAETTEAAKRPHLTQTLEELKKVLVQNEFHESALQMAGLVSIELNDPVAGRDYFKKYLEVNPEADAVRLKIAYDIAQAGDPEGAMQFVKVGLDASPDNADLLEYYAGYGIAAANKRAEAQSGDAGAGLPAEAQALYREVINALNKVVEIRGDKVGVGQMRSLVVSHLALGDAVTAETAARKGITLFPQEVLLHAQLADALQRQGKIDEAIASMDRVEQIQADYPNLRIRTGNWLIAAGRLDDAVAEFKKGVGKGTDPNLAARLIYADAVSKGIRATPPNWPYALRGLVAAKSFDVNAETKTELDFWHGWSIYHQAMALEKPQNLQSATQTKPMFEQAKALFTAGRGYAAKAGVNIQQIMDAVDTYIEIETVLIRRGR